MKTIITPLRSVCCALALAAAGAALAAPGAPVSTDKAEVSLRNPAGFTEMRRSFGARTDWLDELSSYIAKRAARAVPDGERLIVTITDVQRAGMIEPWRHGATDLRVVRETTPPRIDLSFQLVAANGAVLKEGSRQLHDVAFMTRSFSPRHRGDPLAYEKNLIDDWLRKDVEAARR
ncbi:MAG TPA: DUF3016 domain-containing protein [Burkholderiaceae bacterium]|nr:DUF3016 domain-containing protein [Burkholderiaceae bacterium]